MCCFLSFFCIHVFTQIPTYLLEGADGRVRELLSLHQGADLVKAYLQTKFNIFVGEHA